MVPGIIDKHKNGVNILKQQSDRLGTLLAVFYMLHCHAIRNFIDNVQNQVKRTEKKNVTALP